MAVGSGDDFLGNRVEFRSKSGICCLSIGEVCAGFLKSLVAEFSFGLRRRELVHQGLAVGLFVLELLRSGIQGSPNFVEPRRVVHSGGSSLPSHFRELLSHCFVGFFGDSSAALHFDLDLGDRCRLLGEFGLELGNQVAPIFRLLPNSL